LTTPSSTCVQPKHKKWVLEASEAAVLTDIQTHTVVLQRHQARTYQGAEARHAEAAEGARLDGQA
jgi:hypothetical protein